jgi:hypothetical protein
MYGALSPGCIERGYPIGRVEPFGVVGGFTLDLRGERLEESSSAGSRTPETGIIEYDLGLSWVGSTFETIARAATVKNK